MGIRLAIYGASGLTGSEVLRQALVHDGVEVVYSVGRKKVDFQGSKLVQLSPETKQLIDEIILPEVDVVVCCLGTTIKKAGSQEAFREVDVNLPIRIARRAKDNHVATFIVQSSLGAGSGSRGFYLRCKTEMEEIVQGLGFSSTVILRPSLLLGKRKEFRLGEKISEIVLLLFKPFLFNGAKKYRAIAASDVAKAMLIYSLNSRKGVSILESDEIQKIADNE
jgi:uncharacterized protein YbjT (DUF2867 family)